jgi:ribosome biogenesis GTPase
VNPFRRCSISDPKQDQAGPERQGVVIRSSGGQCRVAADGRIWRCKFRGRLKMGRQKAQTVVVVGDRVRFLVLDEQTDPPAGVIEEVLERRNRVSRMAARRSGGHIEQVLMANLDQVVAVQSVAEPAPQAGFVDRLMVAAERFGVKGVLILNKCDLAPVGDCDDAPAAPWDYYLELGYEVVQTSAVSGRGLDALKAVLANRISLLLGASGVGKSTLLNAIQPGLRLAVGEVTTKTGLGRHTTTSTELFPLVGGGFIADSPGLRGFDPWDIDPLDVRGYFPDFVSGSQRCRFRTCMHRDEPGCGVKEDLAAGAIPAWRHRAYLALLKDLEERKDRKGYRR